MHPFFLFFLALTSASAFSGVRSENLPAFCKSVYPKLLGSPGRAISEKEISTLLRLSAEDEAILRKHLADLPTASQRELLEKLLVLRWQMKEMPFEKLPKEFQQNLSGFSHARKEVEERFLKHGLIKKLDRALTAVADHLGKKSSPEEQKKTFDFFLSLLDRFDPSWYHQSNLDSVIDLASGIQTRAISEKIAQNDRKSFNEEHKGEETYSFAKPELLLTPYSEIFNLFEAVGLKPGDKVVDLGAGFGRLGLALATKNPDVEVTGYEIVKDRIEEGARVAKAWGLSHRVKLLEQNLADPEFKPAEADIYFAFNPVSGATFDKILEDLRQVGLKSKKPFRLIVFGPSPFEKTDAQPWLKELTGSPIPQGPELKVYEFVPDKASHTVRVEPTKKNPYALETPVSDVLKSASFDEKASSFLSPRYLQAWSQHWPIETFQHQGLTLLFSRKTHEPGLELFFEPLGGTPRERAKVIADLIQSRKKAGIRAEFHYLSEEVIKELQPEKSVFVETDPVLSDYIYPIENLARLEQSKRLRERRNQAASFLKEHPEAQTQVLAELPTQARQLFLKQSQAFLDGWQKERMQRASSADALERDALQAESLASMDLTKSLQGPGTVQMTLSNGGKILGYASGEIRDGPRPETKMLVIYVQKSDGTKNAIPYLNQALVREVFDHPEKYGKVDYVNMMDASNTGLRQFKKHYEPDPLLGQVWKAY